MLKHLVSWGSLLCLLLISFTPAQSQYGGYSCEIVGYDNGSNCHHFVDEWLGNNYSLSGVNCSVNLFSCEMDAALTDATSQGWLWFGSLSSNLTTGSSSNHDVITYEERINGVWVVHHSAARGPSGLYISKWESGGPLMYHSTHAVPSIYYQSGNFDFRIRYWNYTGYTGNTSLPACAPCTPNSTLILESICTSCNCTTSQGYFLFRANSGFTNYNWTVGGGTIAWDLGQYIYISQPNGGYSHVALTATDNCGNTQSLSGFHYLPNCSGGGGGPFFQPNAGQLSATLPSLADLLDVETGEKFGQEVKKTISIYNLAGQRLQTHQTSATDVTINLNQRIVPGMYVLRVDTPAGAYSEKIMLQ